MVKKAFTLMEVIFVLVAVSIILVGGFKIIEKIYKRNYMVKKTSEFEFTSQAFLDQLSNMLYNRVPLSVIGYNPSNHSFKYIGDINSDENYPVLEWIGEISEIEDLNFSSFADLARSNNPILYAMDFNSSYIENILKYKYDTNLTKGSAIVFAGAFDEGDEAIRNDYNNSFGWHGNRADYIFRVSKYFQTNNNCELNLTNYDGSKIENKKIYAKFYLVDSAYALALVKDLNKSNWNCSDLDVNKLKDNDLLLFYNYRPWKGETFCADDNGTSEGNVSLILEDVKAFSVRKVNTHLELKVQLSVQRDDINVSVSKQKVAF